MVLPSKVFLFKKKQVHQAMVNKKQGRKNPPLKSWRKVKRLNVTVANSAVAVQPLAQTIAAAASTVLINTGVVGLRF